MEKEYCCYRMREQLTSICKSAHSKTECLDALVIETGGGIAIPIRDGGISHTLIPFCPWCGASIDKYLKSEQYGFTPRGIPLFNAVGKAEALRYCVMENQSRSADLDEYAEDIIGHLCDLLTYYSKKIKMTPEAAFKHYGKNSDGAVFDTR